MSESKTNIQVTRKTRDYLAKLGQKGDTYDDIIRRLLAYYEITQTVEQMDDSEDD